MIKETPVDGIKLINETNTPNPRELCEFEYKMEYELDEQIEQEFVSWEIIGDIPKGIEFDPDSGKFYGKPEPLDTYHQPIQEYLMEEYSDMNDDETPWTDIPDLTVKKLKDPETTIHISGVNALVKGMAGYHRDNKTGGPLSTFEFEVILNTKINVTDAETAESLDDQELLELNEYKTVDEIATACEESEEPIPFKYKVKRAIQVVPNFDPKVYAMVYGSQHKNLVDDKNNVLTPKEYIEWRESQGHDFKTKCE